MSIFGNFTTGRELTDAERRWNRIWDLWAQGEADTPYAQLMGYDAEVNNGGHFHYFFNTDNCGDLAGEIRVLLSTLPEPLRGNLQQAYDLFTAPEDPLDCLGDEEMIRCDQFFYENEQLLTDMLKAYAASLEV